MARRPRRWQPEDIKAAVRKRGVTLTQLARNNGLNDSACREALNRPRYSAEQAIAAFIGVPAQELWPDRYDADGLPKHPYAHSRAIKSRFLAERNAVSGGGRRS